MQIGTSVRETSQKDLKRNLKQISLPGNSGEEGAGDLVSLVFPSNQPKCLYQPISAMADVKPFNR